MLPYQHIEVIVIGLIVGFLGGLFGKGGSAIATPMLSLVGLPGFVAVTAPLPATIPSTMIASWEYWRTGYMDWKIVWLSLITGIPATIIGSWLTEYTGANPLLIITGLLVLGFGVSFLFSRNNKKTGDGGDDTGTKSSGRYFRLRLFIVTTFVGLISGFLANSGGFLLAPAYAKILGLPLKKAFACSLTVSMFLALPGTITHALLGHMDWIVTLYIAVAAVPFSYLGARIAIHARSRVLERWYGLALSVLGVYFLLDFLIWR